MSESVCVGSVCLCGKYVFYIYTTFVCTRDACLCDDFWWILYYDFSLKTSTEYVSSQPRQPNKSGSRCKHRTIIILNTQNFSLWSRRREVAVAFFFHIRMSKM